MNRIAHRILPCALLTLLCVCGVSAYAQDVVCSASGMVFFETPSGTPITLKRAEVALIYRADSLKTVTGNDGSFILKKVPAGVATLRVTHEDCMPFLSEIEIAEGNNYFYVKMDNVLLESALVQAEAPLVSHRKDTTIFNAAAVSTMEGDNAIEILRQMPGIEIKSGKIYVDGKIVDRTYVNGRLIFGNNVMTPLNSLLAEDVVNIKTYEEETLEAKRSGLKTSQKSRVLDVTTKTPVLSAFDGYAVASGGLDQQRTVDGKLQGRYIAGVNANFFSEKLLLFFNVYANNVGWENNAFSAYNNLPGALDSYKDKVSVSTGFEKYWGTRMECNMLSARYSFDRDYSLAQNLKQREYFATQSSPARFQEDTTFTSSTDGVHHLNVSGAVYDKTAGRFYTQHNLNISNTERESRLLSSLDIPGQGFNYQDYIQKNADRKIEYNGRFNWEKRSPSCKLEPYVSLNWSLGDVGRKEFTIDTLSSTFSKKYLEATGSAKDYNFGGAAGTRIKLVNTSSLSLTITPSYIVRKSRLSKIRMSMDVLDPDNPVADRINSYDYHWDEFRHGPALTGSADFSGRTMVLNSSLDFTQVLDNEAGPLQSADKYRFIVPWFSLFYSGQGSQGLYFDIHFDVKGNVPAIEQLRNQLDDRNALYLSAGNPSLRQEIRNTLNPRITLFQGKTNRLTFDGNFSATIHPITAKRIFYASDTHLESWGGYDIKAGSTLNTWDNAPYALSLSPMLNYTDRIQKIRSNLKLTAGFSYNLRPQYISENLAKMSEWAPTVSGALYYSPSQLTRLALSHNVTYVHSYNNIGQEMPDALSNNLKFSGIWRFFKRFLVRGEYSFIAHNYIGSLYPDVYLHRLDAMVSVSLLKGRLGISISGNDLLNRGNAFSTITDANYRETSYTPSYGRYFMFNVVFRLNKTSPKTSFWGVTVTG